MEESRNEDIQYEDDHFAAQALFYKKQLLVKYN